MRYLYQEVRDIYQKVSDKDLVIIPAFSPTQGLVPVPW